MTEQVTISCPFCGYEVPEKGDSQKRHLEQVHPEVIDQRLRDAGFVKINGRWVDTLSSGD